jgi:hypothetical protein
MKKFAAQVVGMALLVSFSSSTLAADCKFSSNRTANFTGQVTKVVVKAGAGYLNIRGDAAGGVNAKGRACASSENLLGKVTLESRREADTVYLTVVLNDGGLFTFNRYSYLDLDITVPKGVQMDVTDSSGDVELSDVGTSVVVDSEGDLLLKNIVGDLTVNDDASELRAINISGNVQVEDGSGGIDIEDVRGDVKIVSDSSGDIAVAKVSGNVRVVEDSSGDITILEVKLNVTIDKDGSGDINVSEVGGKFSVGADSSGNILHQRVFGGTRIPAKT